MGDARDEERQRGALTRLVAPIAALVRGDDEPAEVAADAVDDERPASVLIVDDEADVRLTLRTVLRRSSRLHVVGEAADGREAIDLVGELSPDIVLLDLMMPEVDGREAAPVIFRKAPRTMIVVLSALSAADEASGVLANGAFAYVEKSELGPRLTDGLEALWERFRMALEGEDVWAPARPPARGAK